MDCFGSGLFKYFVYLDSTAVIPNIPNVSFMQGLLRVGYLRKMKQIIPILNLVTTLLCAQRGSVISLRHDT